MPKAPITIGIIIIIIGYLKLFSGVQIVRIIQGYLINRFADIK